MILNMRTLIGLTAILASLVLAACGSGANEEALFGGIDEAGSFVIEREAVAAPAAPAAAFARPAAAAPPAAPAAVLAVGRDSAPTSKQSFDAGEGSTGPGGGSATLLSQQRIIIRTVDISLVVTNIGQTLDAVVAMAEEMGGWFIDRNQFQKNTGSISVRVPSEQLEVAVIRLRGMAVEVESEVSTSQDVTEEYSDITARHGSLVAERDTLRTLFDDARSVEEALKVRESLARVQGDIEVLEARIDSIERTAAFSLIRVNLSLDPIKMTVDAGVDQTAGVGEPVRLRATFQPPEDAEVYRFTWDFGDGSGQVTSDRTAPTDDENTRVTATMTHVYHDERDSPYFAEVEITASGEAGFAEGEDTLIVTVTRLPSIEVFAGETVVVEEGEEVELIGSFTRPDGVRDVSFEWDFGDGDAKASGDLGAGATEAVATHTYTHHRPFPYTARLTITAQSDAGEAKSSGAVSVLVRETRGWVIAGWSVGDQGKTAVRALSGFGQGAATVGIWLAIFSPLWLAAGFAIRWAWRRWRRRKGEPAERNTTSE